MIFISIMLLIILFCLALATPSRATQKHSPLRPQSSALQALIKPGKLNIVLFSDSKCQHCSPCVNAFGVLAEVNTAANLHLVHTQLNESNRHIFQQLKLSMLPTILAFNHSERLEHEFECLGSSNKLYRQMSKWLTRLERSIQHWNQEENHAHQIIVDCSEHTKLFWENVEQKELWLDLYCGNSTFLGDNLAVVAEYGKVIEAWRLENKNTESLQQKLRFLIKAYKYKFVVNWNVAIAQQIFAGNQSAFVLLTNNETASRQVYTLYEQIKRNWYERRQQHPVPILFAVTDLAQNTYQTVRLKRYLTGLATTSKKEYFYPLLAFIQAGQYPQKYVMPFHLHKDKETVQNWVYSVYNGTVLNLNNTEPLVQPYLNGDTDHITPSQADEEHQDPDKPYHYIKTQQEWRDLLSDNFTSPFFVYVSWRNSYELQKLEHQVIEWWKEKEGNSTAKKVIRINLLQNVDLPAELRVGYVPSLIFVGSSKQVRKLQGVTDLRKVQQFVAQLQAK